MEEVDFDFLDNLLLVVIPRGGDRLGIYFLYIKNKMEHQDFETIVFHGKPTTSIPSGMRKIVEKNKINTTSTTVTADNIDEFKNKRYNRIIQKNVMDLRLKLKLTRKAFAQSLNVAEADIREMETGGIIDPRLRLVEKINRRYRVSIAETV
jgi:DNA-binding transcriptional regulator YiaG